jgi:ABC-type glycerol-3-phosphate transport system permease component
MSASVAEARPAEAHPAARQRKPFSAGLLFTYLIVTIVAVILVFPFFWMLSTSFKSDLNLSDIPPTILPHPLKWSNWSRTFNQDGIPVFRFLVNSIIVTSIVVIGQVLTSTMVGFAFARLKWYGRDVCFAVLVATMMLPSQVTIVPVFIGFSKLHLVNSWWPLIIPAWFGSPFFIFLARQFMLTLPRDLDDAARIDGATTWQLYSQVIIPLCRPIVATVAVFSFQSQWNDFFNPLIYITDQSKQLLSVGITYFTTQQTTIQVTPWNLVMVASVVMTIPMIIIFFLAQRVFVEGVVFSGLKG